MSSLKVIRRQTASQAHVDIRLFVAAADQAVLAGDRQTCIDLIEQIYQLLDLASAESAYTQ